MADKAPVVPVAASAFDGGAGANVKLTHDPMDLCKGCGDKRFWHNGENGTGECSRIRCETNCQGGRYP